MWTSFIHALFKQDQPQYFALIFSITEVPPSALLRERNEVRIARSAHRHALPPTITRPENVERGISHAIIFVDHEGESSSPKPGTAQLEDTCGRFFNDAEPTGCPEPIHRARLIRKHDQPPRRCSHQFLVGTRMLPMQRRHTVAMSHDRLLFRVWENLMELSWLETRGTQMVNVQSNRGPGPLTPLTCTCACTICCFAPCAGQLPASCSPCCPFVINVPCVFCLQ